MASMGSASHSSLSFTALRDSGGLGKTVQKSCFCRCFNRHANPLLAGQGSKCLLTPKCRMRSRNARANQKKTNAKKGPLERPSVDPECISAEDGKEGIEIVSDLEYGLKFGEASEQISSVSNGVSHVAVNDFAEEDYQRKEGDETAGPFVSESLAESDFEEESYISMVEELMHKVKEAEKNILTLNEARMQNLEQLEQARREKDHLKGQVNVLQIRLAEAETKLKNASQENVRIKVLEEELETLQARLSKKSEAEVLISQLNVDYNKLLEHTKTLQARIDKLDYAEANLAQLKEENSMLQEEINSVQSKLKLVSQENAQMKLLEKELELLQAKLSKSSEAEEVTAADYKKLLKHTKGLQARIDKLDSVHANLEQLKEENEALRGQISSLQLGLADSNKKVELVAQLQAENEVLQSVVSELRSKLSAAESNALELAKLKEEQQIILERFHKFKTESPLTGTSYVNEYPVENQALQEKVGELQVALSELEAENELLDKARAENEVLRKQINMLEQRLSESDAAIRSQLELYAEEMEAFQASLEQLKLEKGIVLDQDVVNTMPWDFWSHLLLCIDGWMLEKKLSHDDAVVLREMAWKRDVRIKDAFIAKQGAPDHDIIFELSQLLKENKRPGMHIVHIAAEMAPIAKVGGLGDVVTGLGKAMQKKGHLVEVVLPKYDCIDYSKIKNLKVVNLDLNSYFDGHMFKNKIWLGIVEGLPVYLIEPHHPARFFWRGKVYGENDDFRRFTYFSRAALEFVLQSNKKPDIIHCHDWHTAAVAPMYWDLYVPEGMDSARIAFTCHNFEYQGTENPVALASCGLNPEKMHRSDRMQDNLSHNRINLLKGGVVFSNIVTTVSPTYSQEVRRPEGGKGLHSTLVAHSDKFFGILNGIDTEAWNPAFDSLIEYQYSAEEINIKASNKAVLKAKLGLSNVGQDSRRPLVGCVTRLVPQKGVHLIRHAIYRTLEQGGQFVLLGSSPIQHIQSEFETISQQFNSHPHIRLILKYDESLAHSIYAAADIFVIPSIFEPCGLTQMISMRYGAVPVARRTGGLNDSVFDVDDETIRLQRRNGFTFSDANEQGLNYALDRALDYFIQRPEWWIDLVRKAMLMDFSWNSSGDQYEELYQMSIERAKARAKARTHGG